LSIILCKKRLLINPTEAIFKASLEKKVSYI